jgi:hypothetical protein
MKIEWEPEFTEMQNGLFEVVIFVLLHENYNPHKGKDKGCYCCIHLMSKILTDYRIIGPETER